MPGQKIELEVSFATPAFLGGADQSAEWRTPPFKALLRQWWRIVAAPQVKYVVGELREREGKLFGAANDGQGTKSRVRIRLDEWSPGTLKDLPNEHRVHHPEVDKPANGMVGAHLYLGFGPVHYDKESRRTQLKRPPAIQPLSDRKLLRIDIDPRVAEAEQNEVFDAVRLMAWFGTLGGRSRNGWGSLVTKEGSGMIPSFASDDCRSLIETHTRKLHDCLDLEWPHAFGSDDRGPLIWCTEKAFADWSDLARIIAETKIAYRTALLFPPTGEGSFSARHLLAYPVTNHKVQAWGKDARLANSLRIKIARTPAGGLFAIFYHIPARLPEGLREGLSMSSNALATMEREVWPKVHRVLDKSPHLKRFASWTPEVSTERPRSGDRPQPGGRSFR